MVLLRTKTPSMRGCRRRRTSSSTSANVITAPGREPSPGTRMISSQRGKPYFSSQPAISSSVTSAGRLVSQRLAMIGSPSLPELYWPNR